MESTNMSRRVFAGTVAMGAAGLAALAAQPDAALAEPQEAAPCMGTAEKSELELYRLDTSLDELNRARRASIDACTDYTCEDGTVIPAIWVKVRAAADGIGNGCGALNYTSDRSFEGWKWLCNFDEDVADVYVNSPIGYCFTALDAAVATGRTEEECKDLLGQLAFNGALLHTTIGGLDCYQHQRIAHGINESCMNLYMEEGFLEDWNEARKKRDQLPFPNYYTVPVKADVVADERILPYDDVEALLQRHEHFCVSPCQCRYLLNPETAPEGAQPRSELPHVLDREAIKDFICSDGHHLEKCVTFGEEALFYIEQGIGRELTRDEAREILRRQVEDEDCVLQSCFTKYTEVICCCDGGCGVLNGYKKKGIEHPAYANFSHYNLMYDKDACLKCGACVERCPLQAIEMDDEGYPTVSGVCVRCGQCAYICPVDARTLAAKDVDQIPELPEDLLDWCNKDAMWRMKAGMWPAEGVVVEG